MTTAGNNTSAACTGGRAARRQAQHDPGAAPGEYGWRRSSVHRRTAAHGHRRQRRALGTPYLHLGNARGAAATQPKVAAHANRVDIDDARQQLKKAHVVECRHRRRKGNGHDRIDPGESQACRRSSVVISFWAGAGLTTTSGSGSKVTTTALQSWSRASRTSARSARDVPVHAIEHADGDRRSAQASAIIKPSAATMRASSDSPAKKIRASSWEASIIEHRRSPAERHAP